MDCNLRTHCAGSGSKLMLAGKGARRWITDRRNLFLKYGYYCEDLYSNELAESIFKLQTSLNNNYKL